MAVRHNSNHLPIEDRPAIIETRSRVGDREADASIGKRHRQAIVSIIEWKSGFTLFLFVGLLKSATGVGSKLVDCRFREE
ncbi:MAG: hypothetical protein HOO95_02960 [Gallionella sp.]|nr:hypothetical protein [Gallionella sp.]